VTLSPRTPVLVGAAAAGQRDGHPADGADAIGLMVEACEAAAVDAGDPGLLGQADVVLTPRGSWRIGDPGRLVAGRIGNTRARTLVAEVGVLQTSLFDWAARSIAAGDLDVALIVGGEARWRQVRGSVAGAPPDVSDGLAGAPDVLLKPDSMIISTEEIAAGLVTAVSQYAMIENARRAADGQSLDEHLQLVADLWAGFNAVARANPKAWHGLPMSPGDIRRSGAGNRPLAFPYNKWHCAQWNVDQAACLVMCSADVARARGIAVERWVFPHAVAESNVVVALSQRRPLHRSPGFAVAGQGALSLAGSGLDDIAHIDLYSCFPIAVRVQAAELGIGEDRQLTVTGGMAFAGGPLNNYVLQAMTTMTGVLRADAGSLGLVTAVSGMITKQGVSVWSCRPPPGGYRSADVSAAVRARGDGVAAIKPTPGPAAVATYTVVHRRDASPRSVIIAERADGIRAIASTEDAEVAETMTAEEWCGRAVQLDGDGGFIPG
jgi:acetyl-CoA C-acetyltransferase